ncbi:MAG: antibiotic biosynthesis monooxygenase [Lachnospiraceae bacterium]|nr:antibiotic biosynthesis monooxygenase [Lachnospiraceae bacterium]
MIILTVTYKCKSGMREQFYEAIRSEGIGEASEAEEGNVRYEYSYSAKGDDRLLLTEYWRDEEALAIHRDMPHFKRLGELKQAYVEDTEIVRSETPAE